MAGWNAKNSLHGQTPLTTMKIAGEASTVEAVASAFAKAREGDRGAFGTLVSLLQDRLYNAVLRMVGHPDDALDVTQEAFTRALASINTFRGESQAYTWIFRIAMNLIISRKRHDNVLKISSMDKSSGTESDDQMSTLRSRLASREPGPQAIAEARERSRRLAAALQKLDAADRAILVMRDIDGMDYEQMAKILDIPLGTLKSRLFRARMALRSRMESAEGK